MKPNLIGKLCQISPHSIRVFSVGVVFWFNFTDPVYNKFYAIWLSNTAGLATRKAEHWSCNEILL